MGLEKADLETVAPDQESNFSRRQSFSDGEAEM